MVRLASPTVHLREIDRHDEALTRRFWEVGKAADELGRPWSAFWSWPAARAAFTADDAPLEKVLLGAFEELAGIGEDFVQQSGVIFGRRRLFRLGRSLSGWQLSGLAILAVLAVLITVAVIA